MTKIRYLILLIFSIFLTIGSVNAQVKKIDSVNKIIDPIFPDENPKFPGDSLNEYIMHNLTVPQDDCIGKVYIEFIVEKSGKLSNIKILQGPCVAWDSAVIKCFRAMPAWIPAKQNGEPIKFEFLMPVNSDIRK